MFTCCFVSDSHSNWPVTSRQKNRCWSSKLWITTPNGVISILRPIYISSIQLCRCKQSDELWLIDCSLCVFGGIVHKVVFLQLCMLSSRHVNLFIFCLCRLPLFSIAYFFSLDYYICEIQTWEQTKLNCKVFLCVFMSVMHQLNIRTVYSV